MRRPGASRATPTVRLRRPASSIGKCLQLARKCRAYRLPDRLISVSLHVLVTALTAVSKDSIAIAHETGERVDIAGGAAGLLGATAMPEVSVLLPLRCSAASTMHPTNAIALHGRRSARQPGSF